MNFHVSASIVKQTHAHTAICREVARHLQDQLDADLHKRTCRQIRKHLRRCSNCTAYLDSLEKTILLYKRYPHPYIPAIIRQKLFAILRITS